MSQCYVAMTLMPSEAYDASLTMSIVVVQLYSVCSIEINLILNYVPED